METDDGKLIERWVHGRSQQAFEIVLRRYRGLVYHTCLRELHDPEQAQEVTQVVFLLLAQKAPTLKRNTVLPSWLFTAARLACKNAQRTEAVRQRRQQKVEQGMKYESNPLPEAQKPWETHLNEALAHLRPREREAVLLRFFENQSLRDVGQELGVSEDAARVRVSRAVEKLRQFFLKQGVVLSGVALADLLAQQSQAAVPSVLENTLEELALRVRPGLPAVSVARVTGQQLLLLKGVLVTMKLVQLQAAAIAVAAVGSSAYVANTVRAQVSEEPPTGWLARGSHPKEYSIVRDTDTKYRGKASGRIVYKNNPAVAERYFGTLMQSIRPDAYRGKRIRLSGFVKSQTVTDMTGLWMRIDTPNAQYLDNMSSRPIRGTTNWQPYSVVLDVPTDATGISYGILLEKQGGAWMDDLRLEVVDASVPTTKFFTAKKGANARVPDNRPTEPQNLDFEK